MRIEEFKDYWFNSERCEFVDTRGRQIARVVDDKSRDFHHFCHNIRGFGSPHTISIINTLLCDFMDPDECYLEVGTFCGRSLIAGLQNNSICAYVIDDHIPRGEDFDLAGEYDSNITRYGLNERVTLFRQDYREFSDVLPTVGLYYFDGPHERWDSYDGIKRFERFLSDRAIVMIDDCDRPGVAMDVRDIVSQDSRYKLIDILGFSDGTAVLEFNR